MTNSPNIRLFLVQNSLQIATARELLRRLSSPTAGRTCIKSVGDQAFLVGFCRSAVAEQFARILKESQVTCIEISADKLNGSRSTGSATLDQSIADVVASLQPRAPNVTRRKFSD